jgi:hypothetical protein
MAKSKINCREHRGGARGGELTEPDALYEKELLSHSSPAA